MKRLLCNNIDKYFKSTVVIADTALVYSTDCNSEQAPERTKSSMLNIK